MAKSKMTLRDYLEKNFTFSTQSTGDEVDINFVYNKSNVDLLKYYTVGDVETELLSVANARGFAPGNTYIYELNN